LSLKVVLS